MKVHLNSLFEEQFKFLMRLGMHYGLLMLRIKECFFYIPSPSTFQTSWWGSLWSSIFCTRDCTYCRFFPASSIQSVSVCFPNLYIFPNRCVRLWGGVAGVSAVPSSVTQCPCRLPHRQSGADRGSLRQSSPALGRLPGLITPISALNYRNGWSPIVWDQPFSTAGNRKSVHSILKPQ